MKTDLRYLRSVFYMPEAGLEPARYYYHRILSPARLPFHHSGLATERYYHRTNKNAIFLFVIGLLWLLFNVY